MFNKAKKILIGKDIDRTAACAAAAVMTTVNQNAVSGEVLVFDKYKKVLTAGSTLNDTDVIFVGQATGVTYNYVGETGVAVTGARKLIFSDPIEGKLVKSFKGKAFTPKAEQITVFTTSLSTTVGVTHVLRIQYRDLQDQKGGGQFVHSYRYTNVTGDTTTTINHNLITLVNAHAGARVVATHNAGTSITLTGKAIPSCTTGLTDIDQFVMVEFDAFINYIDADGNPVETASTQATTAAVYGSGNWEQVRDAEKEAFGNKGITNFTNFPVVLPDTSTVKSAQYDTIIIESDKSYQSSDNQYIKQAPLKTIIYLPINALQGVNILACLNQYMASCPVAATAIVF